MKALLPKSLRPLQWSRHLLRRAENRLAKGAARTLRASEVFYALRGDFAFEAWKVLNGKLLHLASRKAQRPNDSGRRADGARYTLRRGTHRLEKGLCMRPRRDVFALDYIGETVDALDAVATEFADESEQERATTLPLLQWACDVLDVYFKACGEHPALTRLRARYDAVCHAIAWSYQAHEPRPRTTPNPLPSYDQMLALAHRRRSVRWFLQRKVPRAVVDKALLVGLQAPSACNRQPFRFVFIDEPELIQRAGSIPMGTAGFLENVPMLGIAIGQLRAFHEERDRHLIYIDAALAIMGFEFALETQGLSSCSINWPAIPDRERRMMQVLSLAPDETPVMLIAIGYPDPEGLVPYSQKKTLDEARRYNFE